MLPIQPMLTDFMTSDEKVIVLEYETRRNFKDSLNATLAQLTRTASGLSPDRRLPFMREGVALFLKKELDTTEFTGSEIDVVVVESPVSAHFSFSTENPKIKSYLNIPTELSERYTEVLKVAEERYRARVYSRSGILKSDYPCSVPGLTADQARSNGWVPEGYELVPVTTLDILASPRFNGYEYVEDLDFIEASNFARDALLQRASFLTK